MPAIKQKKLWVEKAGQRLGCAGGIVTDLPVFSRMPAGAESEQEVGRHHRKGEPFSYRSGPGGRQNSETAADHSQRGFYFQQGQAATGAKTRAGAKGHK